MAEFKDHFSKQAALYAQYRPTYPDEFFAYLAKLCQHKKTAWDCATGNGQAAIGLSRHFERVIATDASDEQIKRAVPRDNVAYSVAAAEQSGITSASVDLVTVAQALHWFDFQKFFAEARRALRFGGVIAAWSYQLMSDPDSSGLTELIERYYRNVVGPYWPPERKFVDNGYADIDFPFETIRHPEFSMTTSWTLEHVTGYLRSWSASLKYRSALGRDPIAAIETDLKKVWGDSQKPRVFLWPLKLRLGKKA